MHLLAILGMKTMNTDDYEAETPFDYKKTVAKPLTLRYFKNTTSSFTSVNCGVKFYSRLD